ncbi:type-1 angiotensin II receptor-associated protein isoform X2 [Latimeria chalumnae]|nr:PREDICTED: type-1 angiotensin II receptor-associated protein isoform X2 [Latimeria chalumnae]|eukprot:XP_005986119.1 PREDICTED: type-1 angiotensin II receptor-associated protein isoform X2 [Latimeria chalumnae]
MTYFWSNYTVLAVAVWAIAQRDSVDAVFMVLLGLLITIVTDIVFFGVYYPRNGGRITDTLRFSTGMAIFSLLLKPVSCYFIYQMYRERGGEYVNFGFPVGSQNRSQYQAIDPQDAAPPPHCHPEQEIKAGPRLY